MSTTYKGSTLVEEPFVASWKIGVGGQTKRTFKGTQVEIQNKALEFQLAGYETEVTSGPFWTLVATINIDLSTNPDGGTTEPEPVPQWELIPHSLEQSLYETGRMFSNNIPAPVKAAIEAKIKSPKDDKLFLVPLQYLDNDTMVAKALRIYMMKQMGIDSRQIYTLSLKRSMIVSTNYTLRWSIVNANNVLSSDTLINLYGPPIVLTSILPPSFADTFIVSSGDDAGVSAISFDAYYGWLEQHPSYQTVGSNKVQISQEWVYGRYLVGDNGLYNLVT